MKKGCGIILIFVLVRLLTLGELSLIDSTEGRYASIAQEMAISDNWSQPTIRIYGEAQPYLGKPPLFFWLSAAALKTFGMSEWAVRLPSLLAALLMVFFTYNFTFRIFGRCEALLAQLMLVSGGMFFFLSGACVIDTLFAAFCAAAQSAFALSLNSSAATARRWGWVFFISLALAVLTKGPAALVICGGTVLLWMLVTNSWRMIFRLPLMSGGVLFILIAFPWYILQERNNPGFLGYFLINENLERYTRVDYGDKYGFGHVAIYGSIWPMLFAAFLPWTLFFFIVIHDYFKKSRSTLKSQSKQLWTIYALVWAIFPCIFFTFSRQITAMYVMPGLAGLAIFTAIVLSLESTSKRLTNVAFGFIWIFAGVGSLVLAVIGYFYDAPPVAMLIGMTSACATLIISVYNYYRCEGLTLVQQCSVTACIAILTFNTATYQLGHYIGLRRSTEFVFDAIKSKADNEKTDTTVLFSNPFSANFYARRNAGQIVNLEWGKYDLQRKLTTTNLILPVEDIDKLTVEMASLYRRPKIIGHWALYRRKTKVKNLN